MPDAPPQTRIAIIGAGISGLAAAHHALELTRSRKRNTQIDLFESSSRAGGSIKTIQKDDFLIEAGPDNFITNKPACLALAKRLNLSDQLLQTNDQFRKALVLRKNNLLPVPDGFLLMGPSRWRPMITTRIFSPLAKLRMAAELFIKPKRPNPDESLESFVTRRFGRQALDRLIQPLIAGIYTADPATLSLRATLPRFLEMEQNHGSVIRAMRKQAKKTNQSKSDAGPRYSLFNTFTHGMQTLTDTLIRKITPNHLHLNTTVTSITQNPDQSWTMTFDDGNAHTADHLILATPTFITAKFLAPFNSTAADLLSQIQYSSAAVINLAYNRDQIAHPLNAFGFVVPTIENRNIIAAGFSSIKYVHRAPSGKVVLRAFLGGSMQEDRLNRDDKDLIQLAHNDLTSILSIRGDPLFAIPQRWPNSMPQYKVNHLDLIADIKSNLDQHPNLHLIGSGYDTGVGIPDCIAAAEKTIDKIFA